MVLIARIGLFLPACTKEPTRALAGLKPLIHPERKPMVKLFPVIGLVLLLSSCTVFKSLNLPGRDPVATAAVPVRTTDSKFIETISITPQTIVDKTDVKPEPQVAINSRSLNSEPVSKEEIKQFNEVLTSRNAESDYVSNVQLKYASLLNTEVPYLPNKVLLENVDEWYGVHYRTGGNTKKGVDCSGFTVAVYMSVYGITLPRVSREQYRTSRKISTTELQEGDLVFFNTRGHGVSHVGIYLGNNRFIHASVSRGVMVNSLFEPYYLQRFVGAGRIDDKQMASTN